MKALLPLLAFSLLFGGCAQRSSVTPASTPAAVASPTPSVDPLAIARKTISSREQWAYDGDYTVKDYVVDGKKAGWKVRVLRINDPAISEGHSARYDAAGPVVIIINENGKVTSYNSPYRKQ